MIVALIVNGSTPHEYHFNGPRCIYRVLYLAGIEDILIAYVVPHRLYHVGL